MNTKPLFGALLALILVGAGCAAVSTPSEENEAEEQPAAEEPATNVESGVRVITGSLLSLSVPVELTTEVRSMNGETYYALVSNLSEGRLQGSEMSGDEFVMEMRFSSTERPVSKEDFETAYESVTEDVLNERAVTKGSTSDEDEGMPGRRAGFYRALEDGSAVAIDVRAGSEAGLQNALALLAQLEWLK